MNRFVLALLLLSVLGSCRIVCATAECHTAHSSALPGDATDTVPHPVNDDNCICNGAIGSDEAGPLLNLMLADHAATPWLLGGGLPLSISGVDAGRAPGSHHSSGTWRPLAPSTVSACALLQRYRC